MSKEKYTIQLIVHIDEENSQKMSLDLQRLLSSCSGNEFSLVMWNHEIDFSKIQVDKFEYQLTNKYMKVIS